MLRASNRARWLSMAWIGFHVMISFFQTRVEVAVHTLVFAGFAVILFLPRSGEYFRGVSG